MALIPAKEFLERAKRKAVEPKTEKPSASDEYFDKLGEIVERRPIGRPHRRGCMSPE